MARFLLYENIDMSERTLTTEELEQLKQTDPELYELSQVRESKRKQRWGKSTVAPYYKQEHAEEIKPVMDALLADKHNDQFIELKQFGAVNVGTAYQRVKQGLLFLVDYLDTSGRYRAAHKLIRIKKNHKGITLRWKFNIKRAEYEAKPLQAKPVSALSPITKAPEKKEVDLSKAIQHNEEIIPQWRFEVEDFLEDPARESLVLENLQLTTDEVEDVRHMLTGALRVTHSVTLTSIKLHRL